MSSSISFTMPLSVMLVIVYVRRLGTINSNRTTASCSYPNLNGVCPIKLLHVVLYAHNTTGIFKSQSSLLTMQFFVQAFSKILLKSYTLQFT
jgi:hypothetical protein